MGVVNALAGALAGAVVGLGAVVVVLGACGMTPLRPDVQAWRTRVPDRLLLRLVLAMIALVMVWLATGWPVGALVAGVGCGVAPSLVGVRARRAEALRRVEAIATWTEQLRGLMAAAAGLQEAIVATGPHAPAPIRPEVERLIHRIATRRERLAPALRHFADELAHPLGDMVVTSLILASERQGRMNDLLGEVAGSARDTVAMRLRIEAARARTYVTTRLIVGITLGIAIWLIGFRRDYLAPFDSAGGQVMLLLIGAIFGGAAMAMNRMAEPSEVARLLSGEDE